jgi:hypothetical protein
MVDFIADKGHRVIGQALQRVFTIGYFLFAVCTESAFVTCSLYVPVAVVVHLLRQTLDVEPHIVVGNDRLFKII